MLIGFFILGYSLTVMAGYIPPGPKYTCPKDVAYFYPCTCLHGTDEGLYVKCENTNLASLSLAFVNFGDLSAPIEELTLYRCNIARFYGPALYPLNVRVLKFIDTPLRLIDEHSFLGINRTLEELHIINSELEKFPREAVEILGHLKSLVIKSHKMEELPGNSFTKSLAAGKLEKLEISNGTLSSLPPDALTPLKKLKTLDFHGNQIKELKRNQFKGLRDAEMVDLSYNLIDKIDPSHLSDLTKMGWCNLSHNAISELKRGTFARNSLLKVLNLSHNNLRKLDSNTFRGMRLMRRLYLSDNQINDVGRGTFGTMTRIGTIDLARNQIKKIDFQMFYQLQYAELLDVSENEVTVVEKLAFKDLFLATVNLSHNSISRIEANAFENCANLTVLDLSYNKLENMSISKFAFDSFTYATDLRLSYNSLTALNQVPLSNMTGLKVLNVSHNEIHTVPRQTFPKLYELHTIDLSHNNLSEIYNAIFQTLFSLRFLNLSHNSLEKIKPSTFGPLPTLLELDMSYNNLHDISRGSLTRLASCRKISVRNNKLTKIFQLPVSLGFLDFSDNNLETIPESDTWPSMNALLSLDLSGNRLGDSLSRGSFEYLLTLRTLNLQSNNITKPPWEALNTLSSLQYLYLQNNHITDLGKAAFGRLPIVFELNLANNKIQNISTRAFEGLLQLLTLNLTNNNIEYIPNEAFKGLVSLRTMDLSHNSLETMDNRTHGLFDDCLSLESLNLSHNKIAFLSRKTLPNDPWIPYKLKHLDLSYNVMPVLTFDMTFGGRKLVSLNLSHNNINELRRYTIGNLTNLEVLDLSNNDLEDLSEKDIFNPPKNLTKLFLSHNRFSFLPLHKIVPLPKLKTLDLKYNNFADFNFNLMKIIENGTEIQYTGNPLHCDCYVRPLKRWLASLLEVPEAWKDVRCASPRYVSEKPISDVTEDLMSCTEREINENPLYDITPDIRFRSMEFNDEEKTWTVRWFVISKKDVGDFYIVVREVGGNKSLVEKDLVYKSRSFEFADLPSSLTKHEICILARDSEGHIKHYRNSQCQILSRTVFSSSNRVTSTYQVVLFLLSLQLYRIL